MVVRRSALATLVAAAAAAPQSAPAATVLAAPQSAVDERQQSPLVLSDQVVPRLRLAAPNRLNKENVGIGGFGHQIERAVSGDGQSRVRGERRQLTIASKHTSPIIAAGTPRNNRFV